MPAGNSSDSSKLDWTVISPNAPPPVYASASHVSQSPGEPLSSITTYSYPLYSARRPSDAEIDSKWRLQQDTQQPGSPIALHSPYGPNDQHIHRRPVPPAVSPLSAPDRTITRYNDTTESPDAHTHPRYSPYPSSSAGRSRADSWRDGHRVLREPQQHASSFPAYNHQDERPIPQNLRFGPPESIVLAPIVPPESRRGSVASLGAADSKSSSLTLPPISALGHGIRDDPSAVLERLRSTSDDADVPCTTRGSRETDVATDFATNRQMDRTPVQSHNM